MTHAEAIANIQAYREGELSFGERSEIVRHLEACAACRELEGHWPQALPEDGFTRRVMGRLPEALAGRVGAGRPLLAPLAAVVVAVLLVAAAFWHPERSWVNADRNFARFDQAPHAASFNPENTKENRYE